MCGNLVEAQQPVRPGFDRIVEPALLISPAIDDGNNAAVPTGVTTDLGGHARFVDIASVLDTGSGTPPIVDMGAYDAKNAIYLLLVRR